MRVGVDAHRRNDEVVPLTGYAKAGLPITNSFSVVLAKGDAGYSEE